MNRYKCLFTNSRTGKPGCVNVRARDRQHALDILSVMNCEDAIVLYEIKQPVKKEIKP